MNVGAYVKDCREMRGLTQLELSEKVGIPRSTLARIEIGSLVLSVPMAKELARVLNVPVVWLIDGIKKEG